VIRARALLSCLCFSIGLLIMLSALSFPVHAGSSDLTVDSIWLERASAPHVPVAGTDLSPDESFNIVASINNLGQETASGYYVDVYYDNDYGRGGPDSITPGEVQEWYVGPLTATAGTHVTQWVVDPDSQIAELNEQNNVSQYVFTVGSGETQTTNGTIVTATVTQAATSLVYGTTTTIVTTYSATETLTSTVATVVLVPSTVAATVQSTQLLTSILTTTVTSYTGTETSTSTIVVPTTVTLAPLAATSTVQTTQVLTSTGTTIVTGYTTATVTRYTGTETSVSTIIVPTTVTLGPSAVTSTVQTTQALTSTGTKTVTGHTTTTLTRYTGTETSTSTSVVYTTVTSLASHGAPNPLTYLGFISLLAVTVGHKVTVGKSRSIPKLRSWMQRRCSTSS
jgi:hypothetical protein